MTQQPIDFRAGLRKKIVFLTGGLGGIGRACIDALTAHGAYVAFSYADGQESADVAHALVATNPTQLSTHPLDLRFSRSIEACMEAAHAHWGRIDIVINNAAVGSATVAAYADSAAEQDSVMMTINADGVLKVCQTFLRLMQSQLKTDSLKIINISSGRGRYAGLSRVSLVRWDEQGGRGVYDASVGGRANRHLG